MTAGTDVGQLGRLLRDAREAAGISQQELARRCGVCQGSLSGYERGTRVPRLEQVGRILAGLGRQLRLETEPLWADVDRAIDAAAALSLDERLGQLRVRPLELLAAIGDPPCVMAGLCAAALLGAPVPVAAMDLVLPTDDEVLERFTRWATRRGRRWSDRWRQYGFGPPDPREGSDALGYDCDCRRCGWPTTRSRPVSSIGCGSD